MTSEQRPAQTFEGWWNSNGDLVSDAGNGAEWDGQGLLYWTAVAWHAAIASQQGEIERLRAVLERIAELKPPTYESRIALAALDEKPAT